MANLEDSGDNSSQDKNTSRMSVPDFPLNVNGRTTLTGFQFRYDASSDITVAHVAGTSSGAYRVYVV